MNDEQNNNGVVQTVGKAVNTVKNVKNGIKAVGKIRAVIVAISTLFSSFIASFPVFFVVVIVAAPFVIFMAFFNSPDENFGYINNGEECGFTISATSFSEEEYKNLVCSYASTHSKAMEFCTNADDIYDLSNAKGRNPELVIVRAVAEGYSPAYVSGSDTRRDGGLGNNFWGIGCTNKGGLAACEEYGSFLDGVDSFLNVIADYDSLIAMMSKYANIGDSWVAGDSSSGGCYYFEHMKEYYDDSPEAQESKANAQAACDAGGTGIPTTQYDQEAYTLYQVDAKMGGIREEIFGLKISEGIVCSSNDNDNDIEGDGIYTGTMTHPCPGMTRISSRFGPRKAPKPGASTYHEGIDLAAPEGTPVLAADGGTVIFAAFNGKAGNHIKIDHGNGLVTEYMHLHTMSVSKGVNVSKGQQIGGVGTTGNSTGNHLHFGVIKDGVKVNPENYINFGVK